MSGTPDDLIQLAQLPRELRDAADLIEREQTALNRVRYKNLYGAVVDGLVPAERVDGRWYVRRRSLPTIAQTFGLRIHTETSKPASRRRPSNAVAAA